MTAVHDLPPADPRPSVNTLDFAMIPAVLHHGWQDFIRAPLIGLVFTGVYVLGGWTLYVLLAVTGQIWWALPITVGFPILGPFAAVGLYEVSRRLEHDAPLVWREIFAVVWRQRLRQLPVMAWIVLIFFLFWNFLAHMIFALFFGLQAMTNVSSSLDIYYTMNGLVMLGVGTLVGAVLSFVLFSITVISLPLLLDKELDFMTAILVSFETVSKNKAVMLAWGAVVAFVLFLSMAPGLLGLFITLPVLGHGSWHVYRKAIKNQHPN